LYKSVTKCFKMPTPSEKLTASKARVVTDLKGPIKKQFFEEVIKTGVSESKLLKIIVEKHYNGEHRF